MNVRHINKLKSGHRKLLICLSAIILFGLAVCIAIRLVWPLLPVPFRVRAVRAEYAITGDWYPTYNRLGDMLKWGMSPDEVSAILGWRDIEETLPKGKRWEYGQVGPTAGGECIVDFAKDGDRFRLCYFINIRHSLFPDSPRREFGSPLEGGVNYFSRNVTTNK